MTGGDQIMDEEKGTGRKNVTEESTEIKTANHIIQYSPEYSLCTGCTSCSMICGLVHDGFNGHGNGRIQVKLDQISLIHTILSCQQCEDHPCYDACPRKDKAMCIDPDTGIVYIDEENCIGCGKCIKSCRFDEPRIVMKKNKNRKKWRAAKCDLCRNNPDGPQCIKYCPAHCIGLRDDAVITETEGE